MRRHAAGRSRAQPVKWPAMKLEIWTPHVTVVAIVERDGRFLVIEEHTSAGLRINQPAVHLEAGETLEETGCRFEPSALVGIYLAHYDHPASAGATYLRFTFCGTTGEPLPDHRLDDGDIIQIGAVSLRFEAS